MPSNFEFHMSAAASSKLPAFFVEKLRTVVMHEAAYLPQLFPDKRKQVMRAAAAASQGRHQHLEGDDLDEHEQGNIHAYAVNTMALVKT